MKPSKVTSFDSPAIYPEGALVSFILNVSIFTLKKLTSKYLSFIVILNLISASLLGNNPTKTYFLSEVILSVASSLFNMLKRPSLNISSKFGSK